jgi:hypothetical protein
MQIIVISTQEKKENIKMSKVLYDGPEDLVNFIIIGCKKVLFVISSV